MEHNIIMTEACGATNYTVMEVGGATSSMMRECGATESTLSMRRKKFYPIHCNNEAKKVQDAITSYLCASMAQKCIHLCININ